MPVIEIVGVQPKTTDVPLFKEFVAQVYGRKDIPIRARVDGYLEGMHFREGSQVKKGQKIYTIDPQPFQQEVNSAASALAEAKVQQVNAKSELDRIVPLAKIDAVSKSDLDAAQARYDASVASAEAAEAMLELAKINLGYTVLKSPISGLIGKTNAKVGEYVGRDPNPVILNTVSLLDTVYVEFFLNENDYLLLARNNKNRRQEAESGETPGLALLLSDGSEYDHTGIFRFVDRGLDPSTGSILVQAAFPNPDRLLRPGQFARVKSYIGQAKNVYLIPQRAVSELQGKFTIWLGDANGQSKKIFVDLIGEKDDKFIVRADLEKGDRILLEGLQKLKPGIPIKVVSPEEASVKTNDSE